MTTSGVVNSHETAIQSLAALPDLSGSSVGGILLVSDKPDDEDAMSQLQPTDRLVPELLSVCQIALTRYRDCEVVNYEPATSCVGPQVMWMSLADIPLLQSIVDDSADLADIPLFDPKKLKLHKSRLSAVRVESQDADPIVFIQSIMESQIVARSTKFGVVVRRGQMDLPPGDLLLLPRGVTAIVADGHVFFNNRAAFQKLFDLLEELTDRAEATFREVTENLRIEGFAEMLAAVTSQSQMVAKMASIQSKLQQYPMYKEAMTMPKLVTFIKTHPNCNVEVAGEGEDAKLVFRSPPQYRFKILNVLDDDFLKSELTTLEYESNSKGLPFSG
jgi:hypothetical protein